jgi:MFS transporter, DHA3 family, multidrug efflux protein
MKTFYALLGNTLAAFLANTFVWFAVTFWVYLETRSVIATSVMAGIFTGTTAVSGLFLGSLVDRYRKKTAMLLSSLASLVLYACACAIYALAPTEGFNDAANPLLWLFILLALLGAIVGNIRMIALSTLVTILVPADTRDRANGMVGTANGIAFLGASIFSGLGVGLLGMFWVLVIALALTALVIIHLWSVPVAEETVLQTGQQRPQIDLRGTILAVQAVPGLFGLLFFNTFNNFLGGVFMALMDAYGLLLVSVEVWGILWGSLSLAFIVGGLAIARWGLGPSPLRRLFVVNIVLWTIAIFFTIQPSIVLLTIGMFFWLSLVPMVEAAEQTILQKVIPLERQGRVFGFAQSIEQAASPITAFVIGPIAQFIFIPFMTTGAGVELIGGWFGTGTDRGIALVFTLAGVVGLAVTLLAMRSSAYRLLSRSYQALPPTPELRDVAA